MSPMPPSFLCPYWSGLLAFEVHVFHVLHLGALRNEHDGVLTRIPIAIVDHQFRELLDVERMLRNDASVGGAGHGRKECGVTGVPAEDLDDEEPLVRAGRCPQGMGHLDGSR